MVHVDLIEENVIEVARRLSGGAGPEGADLFSLQHWLLQFGEAIGVLQKISAEFSKWLANERPHWDANCMIISGNLILLDKHIGVRPVGWEKLGGILWKSVS